MIARNENISFKDNKSSNAFYLKIFKSKKLNTKEYNQLKLNGGRERKEGVGDEIQ